MCDVCNGESGGTDVGVAAVPSAPVSVMWCTECLQQNAVPLFVVETWLFADFEQADVELPAEPPGRDVFAKWVMDMTVWRDGRYVPFGEAVAPIWRDEQTRRAA